MTRTTLRTARVVICIFGICGATAFNAQGQNVGTSISSDGTAPNANAMLDIQSPSTNDGKGLLIPRITASQRTTANASLQGGLLDNSGNLRGGAAQGLLVYQTDTTSGFYYNTSGSATPAWTFVGDFKANGSVAMTGDLDMNNHDLTDVADIAMSGINVSIGRDTLSYSSSSGSVAVGRSATARYRVGGVAVGTLADGDYNGTALGFDADGQYTNIAIGYQASVYSGYNRIAIGYRIVNRRNNTIAVRGDLYLDGGDEIYYRPVVGSGAWTVKAFTIPHPLDPKNKVLRHYCMESPSVWNVYAGNAMLTNGTATIDLPDYYSKLNKQGSEVYSLTAVGRPGQVYVDEEVNNGRFVIAGDNDIKVSWTIKVLRNDPACIKDMKQRPVEQLKSELSTEQIQHENRSVNTVTADNQ